MKNCKLFYLFLFFCYYYYAYVLLFMYRFYQEIRVRAEVIS